MRSRLKSVRRFLYEDVAGELRQRISRGVYRPGTRIPSESELVREFRVSAITVRRAIRDLTLEGLLFGRQGLGVFVADNRRIVRSLGRDFKTSFGDEMRRAGVEPGIKELSLALVPADALVSARLECERGTLVYRHEKLVLGDGEPVGHDVAHLPRELGDVLKQELSHEFVFPLLVAHGIRIHHVDFEIEGGAVSEEQTSLLGLPIGFPLLVVYYTPIGANGTPILSGRAISRADRFSYKFCEYPSIHKTKRDQAR